MMNKKIALLTLSFNLFVCLTSFLYEEEAFHRRRQMDVAMFFNQINSNILNFMKNKARGRITRAYRKKKCWRKQRIVDWWERIVKIHFNEDDFISNFRISKKSFNFICLRLKKHLQAKPNWVREPLTVEKKCAIALYKLGSCCEYRVVANQFGTNKCVVHKCVYAFCEAMLKEFQQEYLQMPNDLEANDIQKRFEKMCGIPKIIGAIDGTHVPILPPKVGYRDFLNRKGWPSYNILAIVDDQYRFRYATCKHPGSTHDAKVLRDSNIFQKPDAFLPKSKGKVGDTIIDCFLLGDPAYPLLKWLIKPYKGSITKEEESFNTYLSKGRVVVENSFGRLKARFRCLLKRIDVHYSFVPKIVFTCLILHNIIEMNREAFTTSWLDAVKNAELEFPQPNKTITEHKDELEGGQIREVLKNYMCRRFPLLRSSLR